jgi:hypothetical protein
MASRDEEKRAEAPNKILGGEAMAGTRISPRTYLFEQAERLRRRAHELEALAYSLPHLGDEADRVLFDFLISGSRVL